MAISRTHNTLVVGRRVYHRTSEDDGVYTLIDLVYDEKVGRWEALLEHEASGGFAQVTATNLTTKPRKEAA